MIKGRRTSPDTGVGFFGTEVASSSGGEETGAVLRLRGGGIVLIPDEDVFLLGGGERSACGEFVSGMGDSGMVDEDIFLLGGGERSACGEFVSGMGDSGMDSVGRTRICSGSAGATIGLAVSGPLSRFPLYVASFSDIKRIGGNPDNPSMVG